MATSRTEICNRALLVLGEGAVINTGQSSQAARACNLAYNPCLRSVLEQGDWRFATKRIDLGGFLVEAPAFEFMYKYRLPNDFVRLQGVFGGAGRPTVTDRLGTGRNQGARRQLTNRREFVIEGQDILTNAEPDLYLIYTFMQEDPRMFSELFAEALVYRIALYTQATLVESPSRQQYIESKYDQQLRKALFNDSNNTSSIIGFPSEVVNRKF